MNLKAIQSRIRKLIKNEGAKYALKHGISNRIAESCIVHGYQLGLNDLLKMIHSLQLER